MVEAVVKLSTKDEIEDFVYLMGLCPGEVKVYCDERITDGKSIIALLTLGNTLPAKFRFEIDGEIPNEVKKGIKKYTI